MTIVHCAHCGVRIGENRAGVWLDVDGSDGDGSHQHWPASLFEKAQRDPEVVDLLQAAERVRVAATLESQEAITCYYRDGPRDGMVEILPRSEVSRVRCFPTLSTAQYRPDTPPEPVTQVPTSLDLIYRRTGPIVDLIAHYHHVP